jgi:hypothetical protein
MKITDNGDSPPSVNITKTALRECDFSLPDMTFVLSQYEAYSRGNVVIAGLTIKDAELLKWVASPAIQLTSVVRGYFNDTNDVVRFTFAARNHPVLLVIDTDADAEFFVVKDGKLTPAAGGLAPFWRANINAATTFYPVIGNRVFMAPGCSKDVPHPEDNGGAYSYPSNKVTDAQNCLYTKPDGWLAVWGARSADAGCSLSILSAFTDGIGLLFVKMIGCVFGWMLDNIISTVEGWFKEVGNRSYYQPSPGYPDGSLGNFLGLGTAYAQDHRVTGYEGELSKDGDGDPNQASVIVKIWRISRSLINIVVIIALLAISFANILHLNINTYAAKKALPGIILGVIGANASLLIMRFLADVSQAASQLAVDLSGADTISTMFAGMITALGKTMIGTLPLLVVGGAAATAATGGVALVVIIIGGIVILLYYLFLLLAFFVAFLKRLVILYMLSMVAPLAFVAYGLPQTQHYFFKWWNMYLTYLFLFPIILFGMAATMRISQELNWGQMTPFSVAGITGLALVFGAATITLKLPKIMTKGVIDIASTMKKVLGAAPRAAQLAGSAHQFYAGGKYDSMKGNVANWRANRLEKKLNSGKPLTAKEMQRYNRLKASADASAASAASKQASYGDSAGAKRMKAFRGYATIFSDPEEYIKKPWDERVAQIRSDDKIAAVTKAMLGGEAVPDILKGRPAAVKGQIGFGREERTPALSAAQVINYLDKDNKEDELFWKIFDDYVNAGANDAEKNQRFAEAVGASKAGRWGPIEKLLKNAGVDYNQYNAKAIGKAVNTFEMLSQATRARGGNFIGKEGSVVARMEDEGISSPTSGSPYAGGGSPPPNNPPPGGPGRGPGGPAGPFVGGGGNIDPTAAQRQVEENLINWSKQVFGHASRVAPHLGEELEKEILGAVQGLDLDNEATAERLRTALVNAAGGNPMANDALTKAAFSANASGLKSLAHQVLDAAEVNRRGGTQAVADAVARERYNQRAGFHNEAAAVAASIDYAQLSRAVSEAVASGNANIGDIVAESLQPQLEKMAASIGKTFDANAMTKFAQEFNRIGTAGLKEVIAGRNQNSLISKMKTAMETNLAKTVAHAVDAHVPSPEEMISAARQSAEPEPPLS